MGVFYERRGMYELTVKFSPAGKITFAIPDFTLYLYLNSGRTGTISQASIQYHSGSLRYNVLSRPRVRAGSIGIL